METRKDKRKQKGNKKGLKIVLIVLGLLILAGVIYAAYLYKQVDDAVSEMYQPLDSDQEKKEEIEQRFKDKDTINALLLGVDEREGDKGRSDTMIFLSLNPDTNKILMLSIPRDTYVNIPGRGMDKINHAYAFGNSELSVQTVEDFLDTTVHFYGKVNMEGLKDGVDALGGVTVQNNRQFNQSGKTFETGELHLNGEEALAYSRMRKQDPKGDMGRNDRQQQIIDAMIDKGMSFGSFTKVQDILDALGTNVETNLQMGEMRKLFMDYRGTRSETIREEVNGSGSRMNGIWYYVVSDEEKARLQQLVDEHENQK
ncbi:LCP family protein [Allobacillus sp. GCM10007491]|uniref:LCP family protein n=1 Tax=Allobacillus saliphilus TaxID=2912308 RepID=A0A941CVT6_9BACI|nr:LCP family protein [Allobacillus saliphilus]MBR7554746.1 LCP family protein [Allobacillus saliphilus]MBR7554927.1 LCP family protein [Allobacillus saliphilus]